MGHLGKTVRPRARRGQRCISSGTGGFTLIESILTIVIVGVGVLAIVQAQQAYHQQNNFSQRVGTALMLANEMREVTLNLPQHDPITGAAFWGPEANEPGYEQYDDLDDFDGGEGNGTTFDPPISANRLPIPNMTGWSQKVTVENVLENYVSGTAVPDLSTDVVRITTQVFYQGPNDNEPTEITRMSWIRAGG